MGQPHGPGRAPAAGGPGGLHAAPLRCIRGAELGAGRQTRARRGPRPYMSPVWCAPSWGAWVECVNPASRCQWLRRPPSHPRGGDWCATRAL